MQPVANGDFEVETKFDSMGSAQYQDQGILVEQDASTALRFDVYSTATSVFVFSAFVSGSTPVAKVTQEVPGAQQPFWLRVHRTGNTWLFTYSTDGTAWVTAASFTQAITVTEIGPYAGNSGSPPPAWQSVVDYFHRNVGTPVSVTNDDFSAATINPSTWTTVNPLGDATVSAQNNHAVIDVPGGAEHDPNDPGDGAPRLMQTVANGDFSVDAKFDSAVVHQFQEQGIVAEQDSTHYVHVEIVQNWFETAIVATSVAGAVVTTEANFEIYNRPSIILRLGRSNDTWSLGYSYDGNHWTAAAAFSEPLTVAHAGVFAGNFGGASSPAFTAEIDYFVNSAAPPATEDGVAWPTAPAAPVFNVWYGSHQTFGANGQPQKWVNVLGDVSDPSGIASLTYTVNGGSPQGLSMGENDVRLVDPGDFNAEIDNASLSVGANTVHFTAIDNDGNQSTTDVTVTKVSGGPWPTAYTADWSKAGGNINSIAQIADGHWEIKPDGTIHNVDFGYDRLVTIGQASTWSQYEVTAQVRVNTLDPDGSAVGIIVGWKGATSDLHGVVTGDQPRVGHPFPVAFLYGNSAGTAQRFQIYANSDQHPETTLVADGTGKQLTPGVTYTFKVRVTDNGSGGSHFRLKAWQTGTTEPSSWLLETDGDLSRGLDRARRAPRRRELRQGDRRVRADGPDHRVRRIGKRVGERRVHGQRHRRERRRPLRRDVHVEQRRHHALGIGNGQPRLRVEPDEREDVHVQGDRDELDRDERGVRGIGLLRDRRAPDRADLGAGGSRKRRRDRQLDRAVVRRRLARDRLRRDAVPRQRRGDGTRFASTATSQSVTGLTNGKSYTFQVAAKNALGTGPSSTPSSAIVVGAPLAPVTAAVGSSGKAVVSWSAPANNGASITGYVVSTYLGSVVQTAKTHMLTCSPQPCSPACTWTVTGLTNGSSYSFQVSALNSRGSGPSGATTITVGPAAAPGVPTDVHAVAGAGRATLTWTVPANGSATITSYAVTPIRGHVVLSPVTVAAPAAGATIMGLTAGQSYTFVVQARSPAATGARSAVSNAVTPS